MKDPAPLRKRKRAFVFIFRRTEPTSKQQKEKTAKQSIQKDPVFIYLGSIWDPIYFFHYGYGMRRSIQDRLDYIEVVSMESPSQ